MGGGRMGLEHRESLLLAPYGLMSSRSRGRQYPEPEAAYRTAFQRDRDRIVHSAAFRRLEYKTQVFVFDEGDYYRTRLTHTLEVAQIGRTLARALGVNEDLVEAVCLAHDLGHPPFGHAGEAALDGLMKAIGGFNHNQQSYRVVTELERRYAGWPGLNLTWETLEAMAAHEAAVPLAQTLGYDPALRGSLEAQIANLTDELAYTAHDLDDGLLAGLLRVEDLRQLEIWQQMCEGVGWKGGALDEVTRHALIRELVGILVSDVLRVTEERISQLNPADVETIRKQPANLVGYSATMEQMRLTLRQFLYDQMYMHYRVVRMSKRAERFVREMFNALVEHPRQLPPDWFVRIDRDGVLRVVGDYIACLTDRSALLEYRRLFDPAERP